MRKTKEDADKTKQAILEAALDVFLEKSYETATLNNIAKKANLTRGAIYWHFENKFDILKELTEMYLGSFLTKIDEEISKTDTSSICQIEALVKKYFDYFTSDKNIKKYKQIIEFKIGFTKDTSLIHNLLSEIKIKIINKTNNLILQGQTKGNIRTDLDAKFLAFAVINMILGFDRALMFNENIYDDFPSDYIVKNLIKLLKTP
ncbi:TetR family transcriptional regulator [Hypnocyclicus thermotrophus]|uniref:TetR family transcriptional regulator n=1 Tax=Hypnocyclicus thermotrophus TaxID=1627895 RepID=A0AA46I636_9FUSO|nr:TetR/AcrR family transcriptional regulator [Hypnocyclicus thermotrophus]TDT71759.1 TetR family transcriptional regulator [Hypnocyclicus thermotrophus]